MYYIISEKKSKSSVPDETRIRCSSDKHAILLKNRFSISHVYFLHNFMNRQLMAKELAVSSTFCIKKNPTESTLRFGLFVVSSFFPQKSAFLDKPAPLCYTGREVFFGHMKQTNPNDEKGALYHEIFFPLLCQPRLRIFPVSSKC